MKNGTITTKDGRTVGFADYGTPDQTALLWCHGGPGSRFEPALLAEAASRAGIRLIGIDRPGYGFSTPQPGRAIGGWVPDAIAVLDHLGIDRLLVAGISTGGAYALALAAQSPRVIGAVACCAVSDMQSADVKAMTVCCHPMWNARSREEAIAIATGQFGDHGENVLPPLGPDLAIDPAFYGDPELLQWWIRGVPDMFAQGLVGFADDRIADANGWTSFEVSRIMCPVVVLHGTSDTLIPLANAHHTAAIVPGATLHIVENLGHLSIMTKVVEVTSELLTRATATR